MVNVSRQLLRGLSASLFMLGLNSLDLSDVSRLLSAFKIVMGDDFRLRLLQHDLFLHHDNLLPLGLGFFFGLFMRNRNLHRGHLALGRFRLFDEMDFLLRVLGIIRHILPFTLAGRRYYIQNSVQRRTMGNSSCRE
jgi:hypothetical protein